LKKKKGERERKEKKKKKKRERGEREKKKKKKREREKGVRRTLVQALRLCTGHMAHRSRGIAVPFLDHSTRRG
jgi:hypothetical protein